MLLYRITKAIYADKLVASGIENRWNNSGQFVIYAASTAALACLENVVHTSGLLLHTQAYRLMVIEVPTGTKITVINRKDIPPDWQSLEQRSLTQTMGEKWYEDRKSLLLAVPSAIIPMETNYLINTAHPSFMDTKIIQSEPFLFDERLNK